MKKLVMVAIFLFLCGTAVYLFAQGSSTSEPKCGKAVGTIRIEPHGSYYPLPIMLKSPATFNISTMTSIAYEPHILLVMTNASYQGLTGSVLVNWTGGSTSFPKESFTPVSNNNEYIPTGAVFEGARYRVSSLKEHLGVNGTEDDTLWYVFGPFLSGPITTTPQTFNVTLPSTNPRMLVLALGKSECSNEFDMRVPPSIPGFVVPNLAAILLTLSSFTAFVFYAIVRRKS